MVRGMRERTRFFLYLLVFAAAYRLPVDRLPFGGPPLQALVLLHDYAREHVLLCLAPAFFIAGAIAVFLSRATILRYLGARAPKPLAYGVAALSGAILAVCSCTVLPLFAGIHKRGAGLGPAIAFLYSGPAINIMAIVLTARVLGFELGAARAIGAVTMSVLIGLAMHLLFRREEHERAAGTLELPDNEAPERPLWLELIFFGAMIAVLVFANLGALAPIVRWGVAGIALLIVVGIAARSFSATSRGYWYEASWSFARRMLPLLFAGILIAGFLLGSPGAEGLIPSRFIAAAVGGEGVGATFLAAIIGAFLYFATLTEVPILQGLLGAGMGKGPALALLLAGPALSLPNMLVIRGVLGTRKTLAYVVLVVIASTAAGLLYGALSAGG